MDLGRKKKFGAHTCRGLKKKDKGDKMEGQIKGEKSKTSRRKNSIHKEGANGGEERGQTEWLEKRRINGLRRGTAPAKKKKEEKGGGSQGRVCVRGGCHNFTKEGGGGGRNGGEAKKKRKSSRLKGGKKGEPYQNR